MSDNPRTPGHPSDLPSSRVTGRITDSTGSSSNSGSSTPVPSPPVSSPNKINIRNIIIGAIVTVITSTTVYYLTQNLKKPEENSFATTREATTAAWKSYLAYENIYTKNTLSLSKNTGGLALDSLLKTIKKESDKFQKDLIDLASGKKIDKDLIKAMNRRLDNENSSFPVLEQYYKNIDRINKSNGSFKEKKDALVNEMSRYSEFTKGFFERSVNDIQVIAETLSKRYGEEYSMNDFLVVQMEPQIVKTNDSVINVLRNIEFDSTGNVVQKVNPVSVKEKDITGSWDADGQVFTFDKNGKMAWVLGNGEKSAGTWKIEDNLLRLEATLASTRQKGFWRFYVLNITENSFTLVSAKDNTVIYYLVRIAHG